MKTPSRVGACLLAALLLAGVVAAQDHDHEANPSDPEVARVEEMARQAWQEAQQFRKAGGKEEDPRHPNRKWAAALWQYREQNPGTAAAARATAESLHLLIHANGAAEMMAKADALPADDPSWRYLLGYLNEAARITKDETFFAAKLRFLAERSTDRETKSAVAFQQGLLYEKASDADLAKAAFQQAIDLSPDSRRAKEARGKLDELTLLNVGQPAPLFAARTHDGATLSLADYKGKVVVLDFWSTSCGVCVSELPLLKELLSKHGKQGLAIVGVSLDEDVKPLREMIALKGIGWPQLFDGKGFQGPVAGLYNVRGTPSYYVLDRGGRIAAKNVPGSRLGEVLAEVLKR